MENTLNQELLAPRNKAFWERHLEMQNSSGLSRAKYCRENSISYATFCYWIRKKAGLSSPLVRVKLKSSDTPTSADALCKLHFSNGCHLAIYDFQALSFILSEIR